MVKNFMNKWALTGATIFLSICLVILLLNGCSTNTTEPITENTSQLSIDWLHNNTGPDLVPAYIDTGVDVAILDQATGYIDISNTQGGNFILDLDGVEVKFLCTGSALDSDTLVRITVIGEVVETPYGKIYLYECGPEGLVFDKPIQIHQEVITTKGEASLFYFNEITGQWELQGTEPISLGRVQFYISHFSKYGISY